MQMICQVFMPVVCQVFMSQSAKNTHKKVVNKKCHFKNFVAQKFENANFLCKN